MFHLLPDHECALAFNFALEEMRVIISMLVYRYQFEKVGNDPVQYDPAFQLVRPIKLLCESEEEDNFAEEVKKIVVDSDYKSLSAFRYLDIFRVYFT